MTTAAIDRAVVAVVEVQVMSEAGARRTERTRPVVAELTHAIPISTAAPASSREEDGISVCFTGYKITVVPTLGCPSPRAVSSYPRHV